MLRNLIKKTISFTAKELAKAYFDEYQKRYPYGQWSIGSPVNIPSVWEVEKPESPIWYTTSAPNINAHTTIFTDNLDVRGAQNIGNTN